MPPSLCTKITQMNEFWQRAFTAIATDVNQAWKIATSEWEAKIQDAQAKLPGYRGSYLQPPAPDNQDSNGRPYCALIKPENLQKWFEAPERLKLIQEAEEF